MRDALKNVFGKELVLEDGTIFLYTVQPYEMKNIIGQIVAVLHEYYFTKKDGKETYKLYRTKEGNWYDANKENTVISSKVFMNLKKAVSLSEKQTYKNSSAANE